MQGGNPRSSSAKTSVCSRREGGIVVRGREVRHQGREPQRPAPVGQLAPDGERVRRRHAPAPHARVGLDVDVAGDARGAQARVVLERGDDDLEARRARPPRPARAATARRAARRRRAPRAARAPPRASRSRRAPRRPPAPRPRTRPRRARSRRPSRPPRPRCPPATRIEAPHVRAHGAEIDLERRARHASSRPSGSSRSPATIAPSSETARRAAEPCATAASASASAGGSPRAQSAPDRAREHVARAGRRELRHGRLDDAERLARRGDERVGPLQQHGGAGALGGLADAREARARDRRAVAPEQAPELARMRRQRRRPGALRQRLEPPGEREQRVRIQHERRLDAAHERVDQLASPPACARAPGPTTTAPARAASSSTRSGRELAVHHQLGCVRGDGGVLALGDAHPDDARRPPRNAASAASAGAPLMPGEPPTTSTPPASYFDPVAERGGHEREVGGLHAHARAAGRRARSAGRSAARSPRPSSRARARSRCRACARGRRASAPPRSRSPPRGRSRRPPRSARRARRSAPRGALTRATSASAAPSRRPWKPLPKSASTITSASSGRALGHAERGRGRAHRARVGRRALGRRVDAHARREARDVQVAGHDEAVAAVVAGARTARSRARRRRSARARAGPPRRPHTPSTRCPAARARESPGCRARVPLPGTRAVASPVHANGRPTTCRCLPGCDFDDPDRQPGTARPRPRCARCSSRPRQPRAQPRSTSSPTPSSRASPTCSARPAARCSRRRRSC